MRVRSPFPSTFSPPWLPAVVVLAAVVATAGCRDVRNLGQAGEGEGEGEGEGSGEGEGKGDISGCTADESCAAMQFCLFVANGISGLCVSGCRVQPDNCTTPTSSHCNPSSHRCVVPPCASDDDCAVDSYCQDPGTSGTCTLGCRLDPPDACGEGRFCNEATHRCDDCCARDCSVDGCPEGLLCNLVLKMCVACLQTPDCKDDEVCVDTVCEKAFPDGCAEGSVCNKSTRQCDPIDNCLTGTPCPVDMICCPATSHCTLGECRSAACCAGSQPCIDEGNQWCHGAHAANYYCMGDNTCTVAGGCSDAVCPADSYCDQSSVPPDCMVGCRIGDLLACQDQEAPGKICEAETHTCQYPPCPNGQQDCTCTPDEPFFCSPQGRCEPVPVPGGCCADDFCDTANGQHCSADTHTCTVPSCELGDIQCQDGTYCDELRDPPICVPCCQPGEQCPADNPCNGADDICHGEVDGGLHVGESCVAPGVCGAGVLRCKADGTTECSSLDRATPELCNGLDDDCDGQTDEGFDADGDGFTACGGDCDDLDPSVHPGPTEVCNGVDDDCDGLVDEDFALLDATWTFHALGEACPGQGVCPMGQVECNDDGSATHCSTLPGGSDDRSSDELCNGLDDDCDGQTDEGLDDDHDRHGKLGGPVCPADLGGAGTDCDDGNTDVHPGAAEICGDGLDNDCDGETDEDYACCEPGPINPGAAVQDQWARVCPGTFTMGSSHGERGWGGETPHSVTLTRPFLMQATEVTQRQWLALMESTPSSFRVGGWCGCQVEPCDDRPVETVNWYDAVAYCNALSLQDGLEECYTLAGCQGTPGGGCAADGEACDGGYTCDSVTFAGLDCAGYRLPTEAEWEYAARAGDMRDTYNGDLGVRNCDEPNPVLDGIAWFCGNSGGLVPRTHPVATLDANAWGLHDVLGNVMEWCWDPWEASDYPAGAATDPTGLEAGSYRVGRGGFWNSDAWNVRLARRIVVSPGYRAWTLGFRPVRTVPCP